MKKVFLILIVIILAAGTIYFFRNKTRTQTFVQPPSTYNKPTNNNKPMQIQSPAFADNQAIPAAYTCDGGNVNPPLRFSDVPADAKSLALVVDDPDAPTGTWVHWLAWDINPATAEIAENSVPAEATQGTTSFGQTVYGGPCPPAGPAHHYHFKLYALANKLNLPTRTTKAELEQAMNGQIIAQAELVGIYGRK